MTKEREIKQVIETYRKEAYCKLVKWLYDNHKKTLRDWEKIEGLPQIEFLGEEKK